MLTIRDIATPAEATLSRPQSSPHHPPTSRPHTSLQTPGGRLPCSAKMDPPNELSWVIWAATSPYSPLNLGHLPQPIPADAPPALQDGVFTFEDAFEDLLTVTAGRRLPDIGTKYETRKMLSQMFPYGEDAAFWVRRLQSQGLLDNANFFPFQARAMWPHDVWESIHREFARAAEEARRAEERWMSRFEEGRRGERGDEDRERRRYGLFDELDKLFRSFESGMSGEEKKGDPERQNEDSGRKGDPERKERRKEASTEDDLYSSVQSAFSSGAKSLGTLVKMARDGVADIQNSHSSSSTARWGQQKGERVESKEEFTDEAGNRHEKRIVRTLDKEGNEVGREVHVRVSSPPPREERPLQADDQEQKQKPPEDSKGDKGNKGGKGGKGSSDDSGWFWK